MFSLYEMVRLKNDDLRHNVKSTYIGTIVDILDEGRAYTVEFINENGNTVDDALLTEYTYNELEQII